MWLRCGLWITLVFFTGRLNGQTNRGEVNLNGQPKDVTVRVGSPATIQCKVENADPGVFTFQWKGYSIDVANPQQGEVIYQVPPRPDGEPSDDNRHEIEGTYDLKIKQATLQDGGFYSCRLNNDEYTANLVVVGKPKLTRTEDLIHGRNVVIKCSVDYSGPENIETSQTPELIMKLGDRELTSTVVPDADNDNDRITTLEVETTYRVDGKHHDEEIKCHVRTTDPFFDESASETLDIKFGPTNMTFGPMKDEYYPGDIITCGAEGNPAPRYQWTAVRSEGARPVTGSDLEVLADMEGDNTWKCVASPFSGVAQPVEREFNFLVLKSGGGDGGDGEQGESTSNGTPPGIIAVAIIIPLLVIIIVIAILLYCCWYKRRAPKYTGDEPPVSDKPVYDNRAATGDHPQDAGIPSQQRPTRPSPNAKYENTPNNNVPQKDHPVSHNPNPGARLDMPVRSGKDSPGYADLGVRQINASNPDLHLNVSFDQSEGEGDRSFSIKPDAGYNNQMYQPDGARGGPGGPGGPPRQQPQPQARHYETNTEV